MLAGLEHGRLGQALAGLSPELRGAIEATVLDGLTCAEAAVLLGVAEGTVKWFNSQKGYGFIQPTDGSKDVFVHITDVERAGLTGLNEGQKVSFDLERGQQGKMSATNLKAV